MRQQRTVAALQGSSHRTAGWRGERLRRRLQSPPRRGHTVAGQVSATEVFPSSSCSSVKVTRWDAAASFYPVWSQRVPARTLITCPAPSAFVGHAAALPRMLFLELSCLVLPGSRKHRPNSLTTAPAPGIHGNISVPASLGVQRCEMLRVRKSPQQGHNLDSLCNTDRLPNRRHEMEERLHLYNSALKISLFCS